METTQLLIVIVITVLTIILTAVGIQVFFILGEVRESIRKLNQVLDNAAEVSDAIAKPIISLGDSLTGLSGLTGLFGWLSKRGKKTKDEQT